jgi:dihydroxyacetone kinase-like predicted kinase
MPTKKRTVKKAAKAVKKTTRKVVRKAATKKKAVAKAAKKTVRKATRATKEKRCACKETCKPDEAFWVNNGPVVDTLGGLKTALKDMSDEQYAHHTKRGKNDFASWIEQCMCDKSCASRVRKARSRPGAVRALAQKCSCKK